MRQVMMRMGLGVAAVALLMADAAQAQSPAAEPEPSAKEIAGEAAKDVVTAPARDLGVSKKEIPPVLVQASADPYGLTGLASCRQLSDAVKELNVALGPDYMVGARPGESKSATLAKAGGDAAVSAVIPFRGLIREASGAASAERHYQAAVDAGLARRGFLRGVHYKQGCRTTF